jgi:hypothetical protein
VARTDSQTLEGS